MRKMYSVRMFLQTCKPPNASIKQKRKITGGKESDRNKQQNESKSQVLPEKMKEIYQEKNEEQRKHHFGGSLCKRGKAAPFSYRPPFSSLNMIPGRQSVWASVSPRRRKQRGGKTTTLSQFRFRLDCIRALIHLFMFQCVQDTDVSALASKS
ncbi:hypothetical protein TNCT_28071 [Trichonephila clavata]|uniref:Uncharacterized protein n=1 Tax=Trichonephila clavata TaxID=2740835 RepID=A0A8X6FK81_TRICU|nr:hypothetical protein TNCT_28071 [Trichonephila clavata]